VPGEKGIGAVSISTTPPAGKGIGVELQEFNDLEKKGLGYLLSETGRSNSGGEP